MINFMKKCYLTIILFFYINFLWAQVGEWTWMNGDSAQIPVAYFGTQGVFDPLNTPPALYEACEWTDLQGNFWLFGGANNYSDLWKFDPSINQWAWIKGPGTLNQLGIYGTQGVPSPANNPGARSWGCATWVDLNNNLWLFGGLAYDANGGYNEINDLWKYDISTNEWTWMKGADTIFSPGVFGTMGIPSPANTPPCMWENNGSWTDGNNNLWLFGGMSYTFLNATLNTLWKYDISTNQWTWVNGTNTGNPPAVYGIRGVSSPNNNPGGRTVYCKWKDSNDNLWFFGGGYANQRKNDLWKYSILIDEWTWMSGDSATIGDVELASSRCIPSVNNVPEGRYENRACWIRECDNLSMFGGYGATGTHNDLWNYKISTNEWTLISGDTALNLQAVYGTKTVSNPGNKPAASGGAIGWKDINGNLWLFGGNGGGNTMWRYVPDSTCPYLCPDTSVIDSLPSADTLIIPNVFTPNNDGKNDLFIPIKNIGMTINEISIFNRWGMLVHYENFPKILWDGKIKNRNASDGTYYWIVKYQNSKGINNMLRGHLMLFK
jgi:gliding motility-associated-like protein